MSPLGSWLFILCVCGAVLCYAYAAIKVFGAVGDWLTGRAAERDRVWHRNLRVVKPAGVMIRRKVS